MKRILSFILAAAMLVSLMISPAAAAGFRDVAPTHWARQDIEAMQEAGLVKGVGDGRFDPTGKLSRVQFLAMAVRLLEQETGNTVTPAASGGYWGAPYYTGASALHLFGGGDDDALPLSGIDGSRPSLDADITRYEMAVIANNVLASLPGYTYDTSTVGSAVMPDYGKLPAQYKEAVCRMYALGILTGQSGGYFNGGKTLTRAESCAVLSRLKTRCERLFPGGGSIEVHFIDVGQADAALILCGGEAMLIDGGNVADSDLIYAYLKREQISHLKYIVATHPHEDHMGGLAGALNYAAVGTFFCPVTEDDSIFFQNVKKYLAKQGKSITVPRAGSSYTLGGASFQFLGPIRPSDNANDLSLVLRLCYKNNSFLFTGDAENAEEQDILASGRPLRADVLKVGHHGSDTSTGYHFLREAAPRYAVISCGKSNSYGHPDEAVLSRLRDADVKLYRTDLQGTIVCTGNGQTLRFAPAKNPDINTNPTVPSVKPQPIPRPTPNPNPTPVPQPQPQIRAYIGNVNSHIFHRSTCSTLPSEKNRIYFSSRTEAVQQGFRPCSRCKP